MDRKLRVFEMHEIERRIRLDHASEDEWRYVFEANEAERRAELDELEELRALIREFSLTEGRFLAALNDVCVTQGDAVSTSLNTITACMAMLDSYLATSVSAGSPSAGAGAGAGTGSPASYDRPSAYRKGIRDKVWNDAIGTDGYVRDPQSGSIMNENEPWHMGHRPGYEFRKHQRSSEARGISREQFIDEYNNPASYRPELPVSNLNHRGEDMTNQYFGD
jgi:hypothetical protein